MRAEQYRNDRVNLENGFRMLDLNFPLQGASNSEVTEYVVYFEHLLAFRPDGPAVGLELPKQFVDVHGPSERPHSIVLDGDGLSVEIELQSRRADRRGEPGCIDRIHISPATFAAAA